MCSTMNFVLFVECNAFFYITKEVFIKSYWYATVNMLHHKPTRIYASEIKHRLNKVHKINQVGPTKN